MSLSTKSRHPQKQALSRFFIGAVILSDQVLGCIRRELKRASPNVRIDIDQIREVILQDVLKRDVVESDKFGAAEKALARAAHKALRSRKAGEVEEESAADAAIAPPIPEASESPAPPATPAG